jgi:hypothetical protein
MESFSPDDAKAFAARARAARAHLDRQASERSLK